MSLSSPCGEAARPVLAARREPVMLVVVTPPRRSSDLPDRRDAPRRRSSAGAPSFASANPGPMGRILIRVEAVPHIIRRCIR